jgi:hypothetical protein
LSDGGLSMESYEGLRGKKETKTKRDRSPILTIVCHCLTQLVSLSLTYYSFDI